MKPDEFRKIIREEVSGVIQEIVPTMISNAINEQVPPMIEEQVSRIVDQKVGASAAHYFGMMKEWMAEQFLGMNERIMLSEEKSERNFVEIREEIIGIKDRLNELETKREHDYA